MCPCPCTVAQPNSPSRPPPPFRLHIPFPALPSPPQSLRSLSGHAQVDIHDCHDGPALVESLSDISDSLSDSLSEGELSPKRRRSEVIPRRPSFDDILGGLPAPAPPLTLFPAAAPPMAAPASDCSSTSSGDESHFMFPTPGLQTPASSPTKVNFGAEPTKPCHAAAAAAAAAMVVHNLPFKKGAPTCQSKHRPNMLTGLTADERSALKQAGKGASIIRVNVDLTDMMSQLFAC